MKLPGFVKEITDVLKEVENTIREAGPELKAAHERGEDLHFCAMGGLSAFGLRTKTDSDDPIVHVDGFAINFTTPKVAGVYATEVPYAIRVEDEETGNVAVGLGSKPLVTVLPKQGAVRFKTRFSADQMAMDDKGILLYLDEEPTAPQEPGGGEDQPSSHHPPGSLIAGSKVRRVIGIPRQGEPKLLESGRR